MLAIWGKEGGTNLKFPYPPNHPFPSFYSKETKKEEEETINSEEAEKLIVQEKKRRQRRRNRKIYETALPPIN